VYDSVARDVVQSSLNGFNGTVFAYGQTSTGKTYTMLGTNDEPGIMPLAITDIFQKITNDPAREYLLRISYIEIYNENIRDLLQPTNDNLKIHQNPMGEIFVGELSEPLVTTIAEIRDLLSQG
jgi:centromeric protein E